MVGYTDILYTTFSLVLIASLVLNANRTIISNTTYVVEAELENQVVAIAQDFIEESRATTYDETTVNGGVPVNIPGGFTAPGKDSGENTRNDFDDFDDYDGWEETVIASGGTEYNISIDVDYFDADTDSKTFVRTTLKQMTITITSPSLTQNGNEKGYSFNFLRSFYAD